MKDLSKFIKLPPNDFSAIDDKVRRQIFYNRITNNGVYLRHQTMMICAAAVFANKLAYSQRLDANVIAAKLAVFDTLRSCVNVQKKRNFCLVRISFLIAFIALIPYFFEIAWTTTPALQVFRDEANGIKKASTDNKKIIA